MRAELARVTAERDEAQSQAQALRITVLNLRSAFNRAEAERDALRQALTAIAEHDGNRHDWSEDVAIDKPTPQEPARAALTSSPRSGKEG
jgi:chromosome segregation ATPase